MTSRFKLSSLAVSAALLIGLSFVHAAGVSQAKVGEAAPAFSLTDQDGKTVSLSDFSGKYVVLEWFNEECPIVQRHYNGGEMNKLAKDSMDKGVIWLAINSTHDKTPATNKKAADAWKMERPILSDASGEVGHLYGATNTPNMFVINKDGTLAYAGAIDDNSNGNKAAVKNYVSQALNELMDGKTVADAQTKPYGCSVKYAQ